jgi:hypothetical protein
MLRMTRAFVLAAPLCVVGASNTNRPEVSPIAQSAVRESSLEAAPCSDSPAAVRLQIDPALQKKLLDLWSRMPHCVWFLMGGYRFLVCW